MAAAFDPRIPSPQSHLLPPLRCLLVLLVLTASGLWAEQKPLVHPGMYVDNADLAFVRSKIALKAEPWYSAYTNLITRVEKGYTSQAIAHVYEGNGSDAVVYPPVGAELFCREAQNAYDFALAWALSGNQNYATTAIRILNAWSSTLQSVTGGNSELRVGWAAPYFCNAAELLRWYTPPGGSSAGWSASDITRFKGMLRNIFFKKIEWRYKQTWGNNWASVAQTSVMCIAVFCDDLPLFADVSSKVVNSAGEGHLPSYIYSNGQCQESGRDQNHTQMGLAGLAGSAEVAWKQGVDLYSALSNRLALGYEYQSKYNLGYSVPFTSGGTGNRWTQISSQYRGSFLTIYELPYRHYVTRKGVAMPYTKKVLDLHRRPENFVGVGCIVLSRGTLTFYRGDSLATAVAPSITSQPANRSVNAGQVATFTVKASGSPAPSYQWQRNGANISGATAASYTTPTLSTADHGSTYRCVVRNSAGTVTSNSARLSVTASGWHGTYFDHRNFTGTAVTRSDAHIDFDWGSGAPMSSMGADSFCVRWRGRVTPRYSQTYTFTASSDDGVRVWVDGTRIIDRWVDQAMRASSGQLRLTAGVAVLVEMEYYENGGRAAARLEWQSSSQARQVIPQSAVTPVAGNGLPGGWSTRDVGAVAATGSAVESSGSWTLAGSGADIWGSTDAFRFAWQRVDGDVQITAQVTSITSTHPWAKAGVMVRESLASNARSAFSCVTPTSGVAFQRRPSTGGSSLHTAGPAKTAPYWVRLERSGSTLISSASADGNTWTEIRRDTVSMGLSVYVGLAVTSHQDGTLMRATFRNVEITAAGIAAN